MKVGSRRITGVVGSLAACLLFVALANGQAGQGAQAPRPPMAEEVFKKVDILKGIPVDEFMDTMGMFSAALTLNCIDCHVPESVGALGKICRRDAAEGNDAQNDDDGQRHQQEQLQRSARPSPATRAIAVI